MTLLTISMFPGWQGNAIALLITLSLAYIVRIKFRAGLRDVPGPFVASWSSIDRILTAARGNQFLSHLEYHEKYGELVRVGPNHVSLSNADLIPSVYGITSKFYKSNFYSLFDAKSPEGPIPTVFSIRDEKGHKALKRPVANAYSMSALVDLEPMTDDCIAILQKKLDSYHGTVIDFGEWLQWFSFDVITSIVFSNRLDFMNQEKDVSGIINAIEGRLVYNSIIGEVPFMNKFLLGNSVISALANYVPALSRLNSSRYIVDFAAKQLERYKSTDKSTGQLRDMLARFKRSRDGEEVMSDKDLLSHASNNIFAGSDTTAISLRSMFYYLCKNPRCYRKVVEEIDEMDQRGNLADTVSFADANKMQYLQACMKEAMRMHPAVGQLLERVVPEGGFTLSGVRLPQGTIVGMNPWVPGRDRKTYGRDADLYRPERWLEADAEQLKLMERNFLAFGSGARTCLGKNISLLEMSKLVPQLLRRYDVKLAEPDKDWTLSDYWFVKQTGLKCCITRRAV